MVYLAGGSNVSDAARDSLLRIKEVGSTEKFNVIAQFDTGSEGTATRRYFLTKLDGALVADKVVSNIDTNSLGNQLANLLQENLPADHEYETLKNLNVSVGNEKRKLGPVLDEVLKSPEEKNVFANAWQIKPTARNSSTTLHGLRLAFLLACLRRTQ